MDYSADDKTWLTDYDPHSDDRWKQKWEEKEEMWYVNNALNMNELQTWTFALLLFSP